MDMENTSQNMPTILEYHILKNSMYGMTNYGILFFDELNNWLIYKSVLRHSQCQIYIYYKYALDGPNLFLLPYVDDCVYWYTSEELGKWFVDKLGKTFYVKLLGY